MFWLDTKSVAAEASWFLLGRSQNPGSRGREALRATHQLHRCNISHPRSHMNPATIHPPLSMDIHRPWPCPPLIRRSRATRILVAILTSGDQVKVTPKSALMHITRTTISTTSMHRSKPCTATALFTHPHSTMPGMDGKFWIITFTLLMDFWPLGRAQTIHFEGFARSNLGRGTGPSFLPPYSVMILLHFWAILRYHTYINRSTYLRFFLNIWTEFIPSGVYHHSSEWGYDVLYCAFALHIMFFILSLFTLLPLRTVSKCKTKYILVSASLQSYKLERSLSKQPQEGRLRRRFLPWALGS